jgi:hypothetical protein
MTEPLKFSVAQAIINQGALCAIKGYPHFAPRNGVCYSCHRQIYLNPFTNAASADRFITGCPFCNRSYCE